jgi:acetyl-CoA carboxylase carboxyltransferase component
MGPSQAVRLIRHREIALGADPDQLAASYEREHLRADSAVRAGAVDEVILPSETRARLLSWLANARSGVVADRAVAAVAQAVCGRRGESVAAVNAHAHAELA